LDNEKSREPNGEPGYIRINAVHQGDQDKQKGVYHINGDPIRSGVWLRKSANSI